MRIYYATKALRGEPYSSEIINADVFTLLRDREEKHIPGAQSLSAVGGFPEIDFDTGEYTDYDYTSSEGVFYIPQSISMCEQVAEGIKDCFFVVLCGDEVELRHLRRDLSKSWHDTVGKDQPVASPDLVARMERTMALLAEANRDREPEPIPAVDLPRKALLDFLELLGVRNTKRLATQLHEAAANPLKFYADNAARLRKDFGFSRAYEGWHVAMLQMVLERQRRMGRVDWKEAGEEVRAVLLSLLPEDAPAILPEYDGTEAYAPQVLHEYNRILDKHYSLTALFWDTGGDEYAFIVIPSTKVAEAFTLAKQLGVVLQYAETLQNT